MDNYKIAIFHGDNSVDINHGYQNGEIEKFGERGEDAYHILEFIEKIKQNYSDVPLLNGVKYTFPAHIPACFFTMLGDPVFYNITPNDKKYGKMGQFYFPNQINESQKQALIEFAKEINLYQLMVFYDIQIIDGEVSWKTKINIEKENNVEFIQKFLNQNYIEICEDKRKKGL
jgi:ribulose-5-phosphate 4-epimerase/fuculose-1-phosphate aldolase